MRLAAALVLVLPLALPALATEEKRAFEITDFYATAFPAAPVASADGRRIAFSLRRYDLEQGSSWSELWWMAQDGSELRQLTSGKHNDSDPRFSPDGTRLYFTSTRSGTSQVHVLPLDGGESRQLTSWPLGLSGAILSHDGRWLAATSEVYPDCGIDAGCQEERAKDRAEGKLKVHLADELLYRHWTSWRDGTYAHVLLIDAESGEVVRDLTPGRFDSPTFSLGGGGFAFAPDGKELVFVSNRDPRSAESTNADLWSVSLEDQEAAPRCLTDANDGWDGEPVFSPDGRWLAYISQETPGYESDLRRLALLDRRSGEVRYLTDRAGFGDNVSEVRFAPEGRALYFTAERKGRTPIFEIALGRSEPKLIHTHGSIGGFELVDGAGNIVYLGRTISTPPELWRVPMAGGTPERLTRFNAALEAEVDIRPAEELWVEGEGGTSLHTFVVKPHGFEEGKRYPLILNVHGGPQGAWTDSYRGDWQVYPGKGYVVAFANPTGSTGYGQGFTDAIACDWGGRVYRDLMRVTDALEKLPYVDSTRMGAMGWSYGGYMMMWLQGHTDRFKCQAAMMGLYDMRSFYGATEELWFPEKDLCGTPWTSEHYERWSPSNFVARFATPALVITGELDYRVPYTQSLQYFTALQKKGIPSRLIVFPGAGHWPAWHEMAFYYTAHLDWFHRWLGGEPPTWSVEEHSENRAFGPRAKREKPVATDAGATRAQ